MRNAGRFVALGLLVAAAAARAESAPPPVTGDVEPIPDAPARWVTDRAGFLSPPYAAALEAQLDGYARRTGHQLLVYIDQTTGGVPIEDWAVRAFERWRVGRKGVDDGLVLFIFSADRRLRVEVGYGLEDRVPDALAARIINERMVPRIRDGDRDGAVREAVTTLTAAIGDGPAAPDGQGGQEVRRPSVWTLIGGGLVIVLFIWLLITNPALAAMLIFNLGSGRGGRGGGGWGGGGGGGGGGFSGGGGRSGGGGASGSW